MRGQLPHGRSEEVFKMTFVGSLSRHHAVEPRLNRRRVMVGQRSLPGLMNLTSNNTHYSLTSSYFDVTLDEFQRPGRGTPLPSLGILRLPGLVLLPVRPVLSPRLVTRRWLRLIDKEVL